MQHSRRLALPILSLLVLISIITIFVTAYIDNPFYSDNNTMAQNSSEISNTVGGHTPGYPTIKTDGDVLDPISVLGSSENAVVDPVKYLRDFSYGHVSTFPNGTVLREFTLIASDSEVKEVSPGVFYNVWTFNGTIPGPTIRATEGDKIKINFINNGSKPHSIHTHGIHPAEMDGVFEMIGPKGKFIYEFTAEPYGVFPYHCHMTPLEEHITHGLYGVYIVDPKTPRPPADEMVMVMNGYDTDFDTENNFYTVNGIPYYYMHKPIQINKDELVRVYLVNMLEFDPINNFHLHANLFNFYPSGTSMTPIEFNDIATMSQGDRGILEFEYKYPGNYMFHAHKTEFAEKGWMGIFRVVSGDASDDVNNSSISHTQERLENYTLSENHPINSSNSQAETDDNPNLKTINITGNSAVLNENQTNNSSGSNSNAFHDAATDNSNVINGHAIERVHFYSNMQDKEGKNNYNSGEI